MKKMAVIIATIFLLPIYVYADSLILTCPDNINPKTSFTCELSGITDTTVSAVSANIVLNSGTSLVSFIPKTVWQGDGANGDIELYTDHNQTGTFQIGTIKLISSANTAATVTIDSAFFYDGEDVEKSINNISKTIKINRMEPETKEEKPPSTSEEVKKQDEKKEPTPVPTTDSNESEINSYYLVDLKIAGYNLDFTRERTEYNLRINDETSLDITPVLEDQEASYEILGNSNLKNGSVIRIQVTSVDNNIQTYRITIEKEEVKKRNYAGIFIGIIAILILINIIRIIVNEKKNIGGDEA